MKLSQEIDQAIATNAVGQAVDIQIGRSKAAQSMILNLVSSMIYTNKPAAVWREYGCNAADANIEAGRGNIPIEITLPTSILPEAVIRDFGNGMSEARMQDVYCMAGESTKRESNEVTGMIGIGAKAGFAYGEMFVVTSFHEGRKTVYHFFKDENGFKMMRIEQKESDSPSGMEIRVPVRAADIPTFQFQAERTFRYFTVPPIVHGGNLTYKRAHPVFKGEDWGIMGERDSVAIMGNVGYAIDPSSLGLKYNDKVKLLLDIGVELKFNIGDLEVAGSREGLQYKDGTKAAIIAKCKEVLKELVELFKQSIIGAPNLWEAKKAYSEAFERLGGGVAQSVREIADASNITWNGNKMDSGRFHLRVDGVDKEATSIVSFDKVYRSVRRSRYTPDAIYPRQTAIIINDLPKLSLSPARVKGFFANTANAAFRELVILTFKTKKAKDNFWKENQMEGVPVIPFSTVAPIYTANASGYSPSAWRAKHASRAFVLDESVTFSYRTKKIRSMWWKSAPVDKKAGKGVYVVINKFKVGTLIGDIEPHVFLEDVKKLRAKNLIDGPMYAFKVDPNKPLKLGKGWVPLADHIAGKITKWAKAKAQEIADYEETVRVSPLIPPTLSPMLPECLAKRCIDTRANMKAKEHNQTLANFIRSENCSTWVPKSLLKLPDPSTDLGTLQEKVLARYPMLKFYRYATTSHSGKSLTDLRDYITMVEQAGE